VVTENGVEKAVSGNGLAVLITLVVWWGTGALVVWSAVHGYFGDVSVLFRVIEDAVPVVEKYAAVTTFKEEVAGFYAFFVVTSPIACVLYFQFINARRKLGFTQRLIFLSTVVIMLLALTIGFDMGPTETKGFLRTFYLILTGSWLGPSIIFLFFYHCLLSAIVCVCKSTELRAYGQRAK
jgi:hypothetical protein